MNDNPGGRSRLAGAARSCGRYMWTGLIMIGQTGLFYWYPSPAGSEQPVTGAPRQAYTPVEMARILAPVPHFARD